MIIKIANKTDQKGLIKYFQHYNKPVIINNRVKCYTTHNKTILALESNKILGMLQWHIKENPNAGVAEFEEIFVNPDARGGGIASELVSFAIKDIKQSFESLNIKPRKIFLFTNKNNMAARKLYEKFGFKFITDINNLFSDSEIETFYCLSFDS